MIWSKLLFFLHLETLFFIGIIIALIYFVFFSKNRKKPFEQLEEFAEEVLGASKGLSVPKSLIKKPQKPKINKHEERCREIFEDIFQVKFKSCRPEWLENPVTHKNLELDGFNPTIKTPMGKGLAFEYDGAQHARFTPRFQRHPDEFVYQCKKDSWKDLRCKQEGILLIRIPSFVAFQDLERFIKQKVRKEGLGRYLDETSGRGLYAVA
jgi:hypothetical protein